jgi:hypothetical protein
MTATKNKKFPGEKHLLKEYKEFKKSVRLSAIDLGMNPKDIPYSNYCGMTEEGVQLILSAKEKKQLNKNQQIFFFRAYTISSGRQHRTFNPPFLNNLRSFRP